MITVFIDRDGTINKNLSFPNVNIPEKLCLLPRAAEGIRILNDIDCKVIVITNQAGINNPQNSLNFEIYERVTKKLKLLLYNASGAKVDDIFCCPHLQNENCGCRKPQTGLLEMAKKKYNDIDFRKSFVVGDREADLIVGHKLGIKAILVRTGHGKTTEKLQNTCAKADFVVEDIYDAALKIRDEIKNEL